MPSTTQYYTTDGIKKGVPFRNASGFTPEVDALEKIKVETDPPSARMVVEFQKIAPKPQPAAGRANSITVASTKVQNHSNDPNYLDTGWYDICWRATRRPQFISSPPQGELHG